MWPGLRPSVLSADCWSQRPPLRPLLDSAHPRGQHAIERGVSEACVRNLNDNQSSDSDFCASWMK